ncbi:MAG: serine hydroxymethyltransferase [Candidatus Colwellbacteria bacterium]|nr:serine hydroxymethyltransferase [Candidatus Colwellbacteria bacterium]
MAFRDPILENLIKKEIKRQRETLALIPSENFAPLETLKILGTPLSNKYSEGYPGKRYYPGNFYYDKIETLAQKRALKVFGLDPRKWHVNVQPYSGSPGNLAVYFALAEPGETIMGMKLADGGHLTHGHKVSATGKFWKSVQFGINPKTGLINYAEVAKLARKHRPKVIVSGFTAYPRKVNFKKFGEIAKSVGAYHLTDISHIAGLIAGGVHPAPFPHADVVMTTTHKSLRGPRGAILFINRASPVAKKNKVDLPALIDRAVFPGLQGGPHNNTTAAMAMAFLEASQPSFKAYARQIAKNAKALAAELKQLGFNLVSGGTDSHLILMDVRNFGLDGMEAEKQLEKAGIIANRNSVPGDPSPFKPSGIRMGTPALTSRGMKEKEMVEVARLIHQALHKKAGAKAAVLKLCRKFPARRFLG